jgi:hypothetical protein
MKTTGQIILMWSVILGFLPMTINSYECSLGVPALPRLPVLGAAFFLIGSVLGIMTTNVMVRDGLGTPLPLDTARNLVVSGPVIGRVG